MIARVAPIAEWFYDNGFSGIAEAIRTTAWPDREAVVYLERDLHAARRLDDDPEPSIYAHAFTLLDELRALRKNPGSTMIAALQAAVDRRSTRTGQENALADALSEHGAHGDFERQGEVTVFPTDRGTYLLRDGQVRIANQGATKAPGVSKAALQKIANSKATEKAQLQHVAQALHDAGERAAATPTVEEAKQDGRTLRIYTWACSFGTVVLATGPSFEPQIKVIQGNEDWDNAPAGTYILAGDPDTSTKAHGNRMKALKALGDRKERTRTGAKAPRRRTAKKVDAVEEVIEQITHDAPLEEIADEIEALPKADALEVAVALDVPVTASDTSAEIKDAIVEKLEDELPAEKPTRARKPRAPRKPKAGTAPPGGWTEEDRVPPRASSSEDTQAELMAIMREALKEFAGMMKRENPRRQNPAADLPLWW